MANRSVPIAVSAKLSLKGKGRALYITQGGVVYCSRGYSLYRSTDWGDSWTLDARVPVARSQALPARLSITQRLLRIQLHTMELMADGARIIVARHGLHRAEPGDRETAQVFAITRGSRPLNVAQDARGRLVWGEYGGNPERHEMHLYASDDGGRRFDVCYTFPAGTVRHVHSVTYDPYLDRFWVFVGDYGREPGIGLLSSDLCELTWLARGSQTARAGEAIVTRDALLFGTDTEIEPNAIVRLDKKTAETTRLREVEGSSLFAAQYGDVAVVTTMVEPSRVNRSRRAVIYASREGEQWAPVMGRNKDSLPSFLQYGTFPLAKSHHPASRAVISGQAVAGLDNTVFVLDFEAVSPS